MSGPALLVQGWPNSLPGCQIGPLREDAAVRLAAGLTALVARDQTRAERALTVLRALRGDRDQLDDPGSS
jgi:hypothetical protein